MPSVVSSATVVAPARQTTRSAAWYAAPMSSMNSRTSAASARLGVARAQRGAVGRAGLMDDAQVGDGIAQRRRRIRQRLVEPVRALAAAEDEQREARRAAAVAGAANGRTGLPVSTTLSAGK